MQGQARQRGLHTQGCPMCCVVVRRPLGEEKQKEEIVNTESAWGLHGACLCCISHWSIHVTSNCMLALSLVLMPGVALSITTVSPAVALDIIPWDFSMVMALWLAHHYQVDRASTSGL